MKYLVIAISLAMMLAACSSSTNESATAAKNKSMVNAVQQPLEKAKAVEQEILDHAELQRKQIDN